MKRLLKILVSLPFLIAAGVIALYALGGFVIAPWYLKRELPRYIQDELHAQGTLGEVKINPFLFKLEMRNFSITEAGGKTPAIAFDRLFVDFETSSLFRRAWTFAEVSIEQPRVNLEVDANDALNLAKLVPQNKPAAEKKEPSSTLPRLLLQRLALKQGSVTFSDRGVAESASARLAPIEIELHDLSTLPDQRGEYTLAAKLPAGGSLGWRGTISLAPVASSGQIEIKDLKLATLWRFVQDRLLIEEPSGSAGLSLRYQTRYADSKLEAGANDINFNIRELALRQRGETDPLLSAAETALTGGVFDFTQRSLRFKKLALGKARANTVIDEEGGLNWQKLIAAPAQNVAAPAASTAAKAEGAPSPVSAAWQLAIESVDVSDVTLRALDQSRMRPVTVDIGHAQLKAGVSAAIGAETSASIEEIAVDLGDIRVSEAGAKDDLLTLGALNLAGGKFDLAQQKFTADSVKLSKAGASVTRDADGSINLVKAFAAKRPKPQEPSKFSAEIGAVELSDSAIALLDRSFEPALTYDIQNLRVLAKHITSSGKTVMPIEVSAQIKQGGTLRAQGTVAAEAQRATLRVEAKGIALAPLGSVVAQHTTLKLISGTAHAAGKLDWNGAGKTAGMRYTGSAGVDTFQLNEENGGAPFAGWKALLAEGIRVDTAGSTARIDDVRLTAPTGKIVIAKDRSTNFSGIMRKPAQSPPAETGAAPPFAVNVERVHVENGELDFTDQSLVLPFSAVIKEFNGSVTGLSSQSGTRAGVKLEGRVDEYGQAQVNGSINPFEPKVFTDLTVTFRNVALSPLTPYSATFAGRRIASGKLSLDLQYKLNNSELQGENKVLLEQFTLGERVESPTAINLPLDLAIALLTDSDGKINISVPVRGNVDHPEFSYGHLVWQAIRTVIVNIVTAPFRALASLFGGSAEKADAIGFEAGRATLAPPEREKLNRVVGVLKQRPQLKLLVQGRYDTRHDGAALRTQAARRTLAERQGIKLSGADDAPVNFDNAKTQRAIEALLEERAGGDSIDKFKTEYEKKTGKEAKRVNAALALIGRGSADREFYEAMFRRIAELQPLPAAELVALATQRGNAIIEFLKTSAALDTARMATSPAAKTEAEKPTDIATALSLEPIKNNQ